MPSASALNLVEEEEVLSFSQVVSLPVEVMSSSKHLEPGRWGCRWKSLEEAVEMS